jgi:acetyl esterase/lipase
VTPRAPRRSGVRPLGPRAVVRTLRTLAAPDHFEAIAPCEVGVPFRALRGRGITPLMDIYRPRDPRSSASVVLVHGGGFVIGSRRMKAMRFLSSRLVAAGLTVASVDYRLIFRGGGLTEALDDVSAGIDFWRSRAPREGLDPERISLVGLSAGGALAYLAAAQEPTVHRLACCFGAYEVDQIEGPLGRVLPPLLFRTPDRAAWASRSPRHAAQPTIPTLLLHGTDDDLIPVQQAERLAATRESLGLPTRVVVYPGAPHGFFNLPVPAAEEGARELIAHVS